MVGIGMGVAQVSALKHVQAKLALGLLICRGQLIGMHGSNMIPEGGSLLIHKSAKVTSCVNDGGRSGICHLLLDLSVILWVSALNVDAHGAGVWQELAAYLALDPRLGYLFQVHAVDVAVEVEGA